MIIPYGVSSCLYSGIMNKIRFIGMHFNSPHLDSNSSYLKREYTELKEAIAFYEKHCVVGVDYLIDEFRKIESLFEHQKTN